MTIQRIPVFFLAACLLGGLGGCGSSDLPGMKISCSGGSSVQPIAKLEVRQVPATAQTGASAQLIYPDPLHTTKSGTLTLAPGEHCSIAQARQT